MSDMSLKNFQDLAKFAARPFPVGYPVEEHITLFSPQDRLHEALAFWIDQVQHSLSLAMYGFADEALAIAIVRKLEDPNVFVQLSLDSVQAAGAHEKKVVALADYPTNIVTFGHAEGSSAIMHLKMGVQDGLDCFSGSTNWSDGGERKQDNELTFTRHPLIATHIRNKIDLIHADQQTQMDLKAKREKSSAVTNAAAFGLHAQ